MADLRRNLERENKSWNLQLDLNSRAWIWHDPIPNRAIYTVVIWGLWYLVVTTTSLLPRKPLLKKKKKNDYFFQLARFKWITRKITIGPITTIYRPRSPIQINRICFLWFNYQTQIIEGRAKFSQQLTRCLFRNILVYLRCLFSQLVYFKTCVCCWMHFWNWPISTREVQIFSPYNFDYLNKKKKIYIYIISIIELSLPPNF